MGVSGTIGDPDDERRAGRFERDELLGLDPEDPEARAFADHLDRIHQTGPGYTVEGYLSGMTDFAESANRLGGHRRVTAGLVVLVIMFGVTVAVWETVLFVLHWLNE